MSGPVTVTRLDDGALWRVTFGASKGNVLDHETMEALAATFRDAAGSRGLKAVCLEGTGAHFSFGASVKEHLPGQVAGMLETFHRLILLVAESPVVVIAAVRGQCLGGAMELATVCHRVVANQEARFGQPEIALGVFAPAASLVLADRVGRPNAEDLCLTGRSITAVEARDMGLVDEIDTEPAEAALAWARTHFGPRSASSLRMATRAVRGELVARLRRELPALERLYLEELMKTADAVEGLQAFLDKRPPVWRHA